ncbi:MAG: FkbM family methyltransferase [Deltaproteobacteria bacterium]
MIPAFLYRNLRARYRDERQEIWALVSAIERGQIAVDCGAFKGSFLWSLSRAVGDGKVVAFEPQAGPASYLREVVARCGLRNVTVEHMAVSDHEGKMILRLPGGSVSAGASIEQEFVDDPDCTMEEVRVVSLDAYFADCSTKVAAIKIDVEGHELAVFRGAERLIERNSPLLVFECEERHLSGHSVADVLNWLKKRGYDGSFVRKGRLLPISEFDPSIHQKQEGERFWDAHDYCNNFIMRKLHT